MQEAPPTHGLPADESSSSANVRVRRDVVAAFWGLTWALFTLIRVAFTYGVAAPGRYPAPIYGAIADAIQLGQWALLTPFIFWLSARLSFTRRNWKRRLTAHLGIGVALVVMTCLVMILVESALMKGARPREWTVQVIGDMLLSYGAPLFLLMYAGIVGTGTGLRYLRDLQREQLVAARLSAQLAEARLESLRTQLHPHFLFNTLNTISQLTHTQPVAARESLAQLGGLLRRAFSTTAVHEVTVAEELRFIEDYIALAARRFGSRLRIGIKAAPDMSDALIPPMILQPLEENAIEHGVATVAGPAELTVEVRREKDAIRVRICNTGRGLSGTPSGVGVGLRNTRARLQQLYGDQAGLTLRETGEGHAEAELWMPYHTRSDLHVMMAEPR